MFKKIGLIIIFISCFVIAKYAVQSGVEKYRENKVVTAVEEAYSEIEKEAESNDTGISKSAAIQEVAGVALSPLPPTPSPQAVRLNRHKIRKTFFMKIKFVFCMAYDRSYRSSTKEFMAIKYLLLI